MPDFLLAPLVAHHPGQWRRILVGAFFGSMIGAVMLYFVSLSYPTESLHRFMVGIPFTTENQFMVVEQKLSDESPLIVVQQAYSGIPAKVWTVVAADQNVLPWSFFVLLGISRFSRMSMVTLLGWLAGRYFKKVPSICYWSLSITYIVLFFIILLRIV